MDRLLGLVDVKLRPRVALIPRGLWQEAGGSQRGDSSFEPADPLPGAAWLSVQLQRLFISFSALRPKGQSVEQNPGGDRCLALQLARARDLVLGA